ncbi:hypothetical protein TREES_T100013915 [Tupaia chinensis]|uniref:Uncharacterized protein n=1 Tax=Tupaia chinensis TaxID=246437 RepID=L9KW10_TUPCH|nr:hypothetical protein TREES_T100013915 [Tupaia chinensis]
MCSETAQREAGVLPPLAVACAPGLVCRRSEKKTTWNAQGGAGARGPVLRNTTPPRREGWSTWAFRGAVSALRTVRSPAEDRAAWCPHVTPGPNQQQEGEKGAQHGLACCRGRAGADVAPCTLPWVSAAGAS